MAKFRENPSDVAALERPTIQRQTFLCIATRAWDSLWRDSQQIMSRVAVHNRVLYFEPGRNPDRSVIEEWLRNVPNYVRLPIREPLPNLLVIPTPSSLPYA
ncbi:MAG: hypothetical protein HY677_03915, partial [Chloroflexi bacterium]|nr:hypothetical protein [Chloroflexota bacterium]